MNCLFNKSQKVSKSRRLIKNILINRLKNYNNKRDKYDKIVPKLFIQSKRIKKKTIRLNPKVVKEI